MFTSIMEAIGIPPICMGPPLAYGRPLPSSLAVINHYYLDLAGDGRCEPQTSFQIERPRNVIDDEACMKEK